jgi:hypothetical protein
MRTYNVSLEQCLIHVIKARPCVLPNDGFLKQLILYDRFLVDRRRQRQEAALKKDGNNLPTTEVPIQHNSSVEAQPTTPIILTPPQYPVNKAPNKTSMSPVDSSTNQASASAGSIHVIPIQVPLKVTRSEKVHLIVSFYCIY